jgi:predicted component of type VI protein secretion system
MSSGIPDARLVVYQNKQPVFTHPIANDETLIGRYDPISGSYPELDLTPYDADARISRKHAYIYRMNNKFILYPVSNAGTQHNQTLVDMGARSELADGDVIILAASLAMKFHIDG